MDVFFYALPAVIIFFVFLLAFRAIRRAQELRRAWGSGLTAEARCLRSYTTVSGGGHDTSVTTTLHHVYEFTTRDGRVIRFEESNGRPTVVEGDIVTVHYAAEHPEKATAHAPNPVRAATGTIVMVAFCGLLIALCIVMMVTFHHVSEGVDSMTDGI
ncbi:DUF3592 domain-containing protein [Streptomyces aureus]|uniref:DUF3592 domain-containing protein n=1 Tax=Streptomyces aureus TaxID=193461 RepID=UPI0036D13637